MPDSRLTRNANHHGKTGARHTSTAENHPLTWEKSLLKAGLDVYLPLVDDDAIDAVVKRPDGHFVEVQIKARSKDAKFGNCGLFAALTHELRENYWFVFYSERLDTIWILSSGEFVEEAHQNKSGKNKGKRTLALCGKNSKAGTEHTKPQYKKYVAKDFRRIVEEVPHSAAATDRVGT